MTNDDLDQRLWELEYGLMSEEDAAALREQIVADLHVAQLHARVRARMSLVAHAARVDEPRRELRTSAADPPAVTAAPSAVAPAVAPAGAAPGTSANRVAQFGQSSSRLRRVASSSLAIAASLLVALLGWGAWQSQGTVIQSTGRPVAERSRSVDRDLETVESLDGARRDATTRGVPRLREAGPLPENRATQVPTRIVAFAPFYQNHGVPTQLSVVTTTPDGMPKPVELQLQVENAAGQNEFLQRVSTSDRGRATISIPFQAGDAVTKLMVSEGSAGAAGLQVPLPVAKQQYGTQLITDKPRYRPGELVRFRSVTLSRFSLLADRDVTVDYSLTDPAEQEIPAAKRRETTRHGVGAGEFAIAADAAPGQYTLVAGSPDQLFPNVEHDFYVQRPAPRLFDIDLRWDAERYSASGQARGDVVVKTPAGEPVADVKLWVRAFVDGRQIALLAPELTTNRDGKVTAALDLPPQIATSRGEVGIQVGDQEVAWRDLPLEPDQVPVDFYPEGGVLTAGVENRVYFHAHDLDGRPVALRGDVISSDGREVTSVATQHEGRASFRFTPQLGTAYSLVIRDPPGITLQPKLPLVEGESRLVLDAGPGVFDGTGPLPIRLRSLRPPDEFAVVANCRGVTVGYQPGNATDFINGTCELSVPVVEETAGVVRVTVFEYAPGRTEPLAERLVYRRSKTRLNFRLTGLQPSYLAGAKVRGELLATDESGRPVSAVLGLSALDDVVWQFGGRPFPRLATRFLLWGDLERPEKLEDANFYLAEDPTAVAALDLLLGTEGWRRFDRAPASQVAGQARDANDALVLSNRMASVTPDNSQPLEADKRLLGVSELLGSRLADANEDAPRRFDNGAEIARAEAIPPRSEPPADLGIPLGAPPPSGTAGALPPNVPPTDSHMPSFYHSAIAFLGAVIVLAAAVCWRPRWSTLFGVSGILVTMGIAGLSWRLAEQSRQASSFREMSRLAQSEPAQSEPASESLLGREIKERDERPPMTAMTPPTPGPDAASAAPPQSSRDDSPTVAPKQEMPKIVPSEPPVLRQQAGFKSLRAVDPTSASRPDPTRSLAETKQVAPNQVAPGEPVEYRIRRYAYALEKSKNRKTSDDFTESVFWAPLLLTDEQGYTRFEFELPDTATKFHILADGHFNGRLGSAEQTITAEPRK